MSSHNTNMVTFQERGLLAGVCLFNLEGLQSGRINTESFAGRQSDQEYLQKIIQGSEDFQKIVQGFITEKVKREFIDAQILGLLGLGSVAEEIEIRSEQTVYSSFSTAGSVAEEIEIRSEPIGKDLRDFLLNLSITFETVEQSLKSLGYSKCAEQFNFLRNTDDLEDGEKPLSLESAKTFFFFIKDEGFVSNFKNLGEPLLGLFSEGTLSAEWKLNGNHLLTEFHHNDVVSFAMIKGRTRLNGRADRKEIIDTLQKQEVGNWEKN